MALPPDLCPECGAARPRRAAGCPSCGRIFQDMPVAAAAASVSSSTPSGVPSGVPAPRAVAPDPHPDDTRAESGSGCRSCLLLAALCTALTLFAGVAVYLLVRDQAIALVESFERQAAAQDIGQLVEALESWADTHGQRLPDSLDALDVPDDWRVDAWDEPFRYEPADDRRSARLLSLGADGASGGEGLDADLERTVVLP